MTVRTSLSAGRPPRVAVIATTPRNREYGRRAFRLMGCSVLIFVSVDEFLEIGDRAQELAMVNLEHVPSNGQKDANTPSIGERVREAVGDAVPIVHSVSMHSSGVIPGFRNNDMLLPNSLYFAQLCRTLRAFLQKNGLPVNERQLEWDEYRFCVDSGLIFVRDKPVVVKQDEFDLALELFFNIDSRVSRSWLRSMVPSLQTLRKRATAPTADAALTQIGELLHLKPGYGWELAMDPGLSCRLSHSRQVESI